MKKIVLLFVSISFQLVWSQTQTEGTLLDTDYSPTYYRLEINVNPYQSAFSGKTTVYFNTTADLEHFKINARPNLSIGQVVYHGNTISNYSRTGDVLDIQLPEMIVFNQLDSIAISFSGNANSSEGYNIGQHNGVPIVETLAEPWFGSSWWVSKDDLNDKVSKLDIFIQHPSEFKAASNGLLKSINSSGNGMSVTHWQHNHPIPVYLVGVAVTNYAEYNNSVMIGNQTVPIINYLYPETMADWTSQLDLVPSHISFLSDKFGDFPYKDEKYGHAQWNRNGGMEHSTMSFMGKFTFNLVVHELGHQWFGDKVTCATWHDIWLNEGFAEYCVGLKTANDFGESAFESWKAGRIDFVTSQNWGSVYNPDDTNNSRIFDSRLTYVKSSMVIHLMRFIINDDELFFSAIRNYLNNPNFAWSFADTQDFKASLENSTNRNWDDFFNDWIYGEGHPIFDVVISKIPNSNEVTVYFQQTGSHSSVPYFHTPFEIEFRGQGGQKTTRRFELNAQQQTFLVDDLTFNVNSFDLNPGEDVICKINSWALNTTENDISPEIQIFPNPVENRLNINSNRLIEEFSIFDLNGKLLYRKPVGNKTEAEINISNLTVGTYLIQIQIANIKWTRKFLKK